MRIALTGQNCLNNRLSCHSAHVTEHIGQLEIHLRQRLLYALDVPSGCPHEIIALPPVGPQGANLQRRAERISY